MITPYIPLTTTQKYFTIANQLQSLLNEAPANKIGIVQATNVATNTVNKTPLAQLQFEKVIKGMKENAQWLIPAGIVIAVFVVRIALNNRNKKRSEDESTLLWKEVAAKVFPMTEVINQAPLAQLINSGPSPLQLPENSPAPLPDSPQSPAPIHQGQEDCQGRQGTCPSAT